MVLRKFVMVLGLWVVVRVCRLMNGMWLIFFVICLI